MTTHTNVFMGNGMSGNASYGIKNLMPLCLIILTLHDHVLINHFTGITYARVYCNRETREAFRQMFTQLWDAIRIATGRDVHFKFIHGDGLLGLVMDGDKAQVEGCGDDLVSRNRDTTTSILGDITDSQLIVQHIVRLCSVHLERNLVKVSQSCPDDVMQKVRSFPRMSVEDIEEFKQWCEHSPHKALRGASHIYI